MKKKYFRFFNFSFLIFGSILLLDSKISITGAFIGISNIAPIFSSVFGTVLILISILLFTGENSLEEIVGTEHHWRKYPINKDSIIQDVEQEYLLSKEEREQNTTIQERIERGITQGKSIGIPNKRESYEEQFYEGHASQGGRTIDVKSHIATKGDLKGKLLHFGQPANSTYLWIVDEECNFIVANRKTFQHEMKSMNKNKIDYRHRLHKLPHVTLAKGRRIYGSGEVLIEGGFIKEINTHSGHYLPVTVTPGRHPGKHEHNLIEEFNNQGREVFREFSKNCGWKEVKTGAKYV